jgi:hypothetical protein
MHSCYALPCQCESEARAIDECHLDIFILAHRWRLPYPETGSFTLLSEVVAQRAADRASVEAAYGLLDSSSNADYSSAKGYIATPNGKVKSWLQTVQPGIPA